MEIKIVCTQCGKNELDVTLRAENTKKLSNKAMFEFKCRSCEHVFVAGTTVSADSMWGRELEQSVKDRLV